MENVKCNEVAGAMYAFPRITLPKKAIEVAKVSCSVSGLDFQSRTADYYNGYHFGGRPCYVDNDNNNDKCLYCALDKNTYPMLQDKKIKSSAKLQQNKKIKKCEKLVTHV